MSGTYCYKLSSMYLAQGQEWCLDPDVRAMEAMGRAPV